MKSKNSSAVRADAPLALADGIALFESSRESSMSGSELELSLSSPKVDPGGLLTTKALNTTVMRWAINREKESECNNWEAEEKTLVPTQELGASSQMEEDPKAVLVKSKRLEKVVRNLTYAKRYVLDSMEDLQANEKGAVSTLEITDESAQKPSLSLTSGASHRGKALGERMMKSLRHAAQEVEEREEEEVLAETPLEGLVTTPSMSQPSGSPPHKITEKMFQGDFSDPMDSSSPFFYSSNALETNCNRVAENIVSLRRPALTHSELLWLFRHSKLLSLLPLDAVKKAVASSLRREFSRGETILEKGQPIHHLYVVVWGGVDGFEIIPHPNAQRQAPALHVDPLPVYYSSASKVAPARLSRGTPSPSPVREVESVPSAPGPTDPPVQREGCFYPSGRFRDGVGVHQGTLGPGQVFGTEQCVFDGVSDYCFRAGLKYEKTVVALIPISVVRGFLPHHTCFAQFAGDTVTAAVDVFRPIREFCRSVFSATNEGNEYLPIWSIVESYSKLGNLIHTKLHARELDYGAWGYALNRLPENVTSTFCFNLVHALPAFVASRMRLAAQAADVLRSKADRKDLTSRTTVSFIATKERRRCTWHLGMEGKTLVLLRDGFTDLLDFVTMICVHIMESNKLRGRLQGMVHPPAIDVLDEYLQQRDEERQNGVARSSEEELDRIRNILTTMPLTKGEQAGLLRMWKEDTALKMYEVMMHREEYNIRVDPSLSRKFQTNPFHEWALNLRACVLKKMGSKVTDPLPEDLCIDVVSSNTHCIKNLLSSFIRKYKSEILEYARRSEQARLGPLERWHNENDYMYAALSGFLQNDRPDLKEEYTQCLEKKGITVLLDTAMTGLQVDVIPVHSLHLDDIDDTIQNSVKAWFHDAVTTNNPKAGASSTSYSSNSHKVSPSQPTSPLSRPRETHPSWTQVCKPVKEDEDGPPSKTCSPSPASISPDLGTPSRAEDDYDDASAFDSNQPKAGVYRLRRHFIINMDFAFGAQAEGICRAVFSAFGHRIRSVSIMGKAGGIVGKRGDIQLATHVLMSKSSFIIEDNQDELRNCRNDDLLQSRLAELAGPKVTVYKGKVLTVTGTMLQNVKLLRYYQRVWGCVGMEMEGSYFARVIEDFHQQGITRPDMISRFAYYTSDLPLAEADAIDQGESGESATLSAPMTPSEGVPPLYAIARGILERILLS